MATNADFDALIVRITTATNTLEQDVAIITEGTENVSESVAAAQLAASQAQASQAGADSSASTATTQANAAAGSATTATNEANRAQDIADSLLASAPFQEAPEDGNVYGRKDGGWSVVTDGGGGGGGAVDSVNGQTGTVVLTAADVGAKPSSYVPAWAEVTGKPATFAPTLGTTAATALAGNTIIPTNTNQLTNGAGFVTDATAPVRSVAGKTGVVTLAGEDITSGVVAPARLGTGTPTADLVLKGDGTWGSVPAPTGGYSIPSAGYNGGYITQWPFANPNQAAQLSLFGEYIEGDWVEGAALLNTQDGVNALPVGNYWFPAGAFAGTPFAAQPGNVEIRKLNATNQTAVVTTFTAPVNEYIWTISGSTVTWRSVGAAALGFPISETINYNGAAMTNWPFANPNQAANGNLLVKDALTGIIAIIQGGTSIQVNSIPCGKYWFNTALKTTSAPSGGQVPAGSETGYIEVTNAPNATTKMFVAYIFDQFAAPDLGKVFIWHSSYWTRVGKA